MTKSSLSAPLLLLIITVISNCSTAFIQPSSSRRHNTNQQHTKSISWPSSSSSSSQPTIVCSPRPSINPITTIRSNKSSSSSTTTTTTQLHSLFGLGPAEIAIIGIAAIFLIGPSKLTEFTRSAGEVAGKEASAWKELKNIPEEFQKGLEEGEIEGRSKKAKVMEKVDDDKK